MKSKLNLFWYTSNNFNGDTAHDTLYFRNYKSKYRTQGDEIIATVLKSNRKELYVKFEFFKDRSNVGKLLLNVVDFINDYCEVPFNEELHSRHTLYKFLEENYNMTTPYNKSRDLQQLKGSKKNKQKKLPKAVDMNDYLW